MALKLKIYIPPNKDLPFDSIRLAYSTKKESKIITTPPFGKPVVIFFINPNSVNNYDVTTDGILLGQHTAPLLLDLNENFKVLAIHLKPYALKQLLNTDASQLTNSYIEIKWIGVFEELYKIVKPIIDDEKKLIAEIIRFFRLIYIPYLMK